MIQVYQIQQTAITQLNLAQNNPPTIGVLQNQIKTKWKEWLGKAVKLRIICNISVNIGACKGAQPNTLVTSFKRLSKAFKVVCVWIFIMSDILSLIYWMSQKTVTWFTQINLVNLLINNRVGHAKSIESVSLEFNNSTKTYEIALNNIEY